MKIGILFNRGGAWIGWHWSEYNQRLCINVVPFLTIWVTLPDGKVPTRVKLWTRLTLSDCYF